MTHDRIPARLSDPNPTTEAELIALAPLAEPVRRRLYLYVSQQADAVGRDEAAAAVGIGRPLAAFHLDRLVADGLLTTEYRRRSGRTGPGAGRPAKLYRRAAGEHTVSLPSRNYELAAGLFADAIASTDSTESIASSEEDVADRVREGAHAYGEAIGRSASGDGLRAALAAQGFEPRDDGDTIRLGNCPFHALAAAHRDLTCGMNLSLMSGLLEGLEAEGWRACLDQRPGLCCVAFEPVAEAS
jgi:predicted ArsR family transcriptional regulator